MLAPLFLSFISFLIIGTPVAFSLGLAALISIYMDGGLPLHLIPQRMFVQMDSFPLLAVPFFILAGEIMEKGGISIRLVSFARALIGHLKGGLAMVTVVSSMIFAGLSGSGTADASAIGSILIPAMKKEGYKSGYAAALQAAAGAIGPIIPPSVIMIIYGSMVGVSIAALFLGAIIPGILIGIGLMILGYIDAVRKGHQGEKRASFREMLAALRDALWALIAPVIILGGIMSGIFTATEAGVVAVVYSLIVGALIYKELKWHHLEEVFTNSSQTTALVILIIAVAGAFGWILGFQEFPRITVDFLMSLSNNPTIILLLILLFLLLLGCFVETLAAAIILIPVLHPVAIQFGFDPVHIAVLVSIALVIGGVTPPMGVFLFVTSSIAKTTLSETSKYVLPFVVMMIVILLLAAFIPDLILFVPRAVLGK